MGHALMPFTQAGRVAFSATLVAVVGPRREAYGVSEAVMAQMVAADVALRRDWLRISQPETRTRPAVEAFRTSMAAMREAARDVVLQIRATRAVTPEMLAAAGLMVHKTTRTPRGAAETAPVVSVVSVVGREVTLRIQGGAARRARPTEASGAWLYWAAGDVPPRETEAWRFGGKGTRLFATVRLPDSLPTDAQVWFTACWVGHTGQRGPGSEPLGAYLNRQGSPLAAEKPLKIAA